MQTDGIHKFGNNTLRKRYLEIQAGYLDNIANDLNTIRREQVCAYRAEEVNSDGKPFLCDCKYGGPSISPGTECTGCPELRDIVQRYRIRARDARVEASGM